jgi:hypothetical protein
MRKPIAKNKIKKSTKEKKLKLKNWQPTTKITSPIFPNWERERKRERESFCCYLSLFTGFLCFVSCVCNACALLTATMNFTVSFNKKNTSWEEVQPIRVVFFFGL